MGGISDFGWCLLHGGGGGAELRMGLAGGYIFSPNPSPLKLVSFFLKVSTFKVSILNEHYALVLETHKRIFNIYNFPILLSQKWPKMDLTKPNKA